MSRFHRFLRSMMWALAVVIVALFLWRRSMNKSSVYPMLGVVEDFSLTDQTGKTVTRDSLRGKFWIASFIFTRCQGPCPLITNKASQLAQEFPSPQLDFVSISVDPTYDTPPVLAKYAATYKADAIRWHFLTGPKEKTFSLIRGSFHLAVENAKDNDPNDILHSTMFVLVDPESHVRGYYNSTDNGDVEKLRHDLKDWIK